MGREVRQPREKGLGTSETLMGSPLRCLKRDGYGDQAPPTRGDKNQSIWSKRCSLTSRGVERSTSCLCRRDRRRFSRSASEGNTSPRELVADRAMRGGPDLGEVALDLHRAEFIEFVVLAHIQPVGSEQEPMP